MSAPLPAQVHIEAATLRINDTLAGTEVICDIEQAWLLYVSFAGDAERTGLALNVSPVAVLRVADDLGWTAKLANVLQLTRSSKPGDVERGCNRCINYVQVHRFRLFLDRMLKQLYDLSEDELREKSESITKDKQGNACVKYSTRWAADLASALEKLHSLSYSALSDTAVERVKRQAEESPGASMDLHAQIARKMAQAGEQQTPRALLFSAQLVQGAELAARINKRVVVDDAHEGDEAGG